MQLGTSGQSREAVTGQDGRAQFAGLQVGQTVTARAFVDGEPLESQPFVLPAEGGVPSSGRERPAGSDRSVEASSSPDLLQTRAQPGTRSARAESTAVVPALFAIVTMSVAAWWLLPRRRVEVAHTTSPIPQTEERRGQLLESLFQLERDRDAMRIGEESYS